MATLHGSLDSSHGPLVTIELAAGCPTSCRRASRGRRAAEQAFCTQVFIDIRQWQPCLVMKGLQCVRSDVGNLRRRRLGKLRQRPDPRRPQPRALPAADPTQTELSRSRRGLARCASASVWPHGKRTSPLPGEDSASTALSGSRGMSRLMAAILTSIRDREGHGPGPALSTAERICLLRAPPG